MMALPSTGQISLQDLEDEFGGAHPISITEYYGAASGVPSSGQISLGDFLGVQAWTGSFNGTQPFTSSQSSSFAPVFATIRVDANGNIYKDGSQTGQVDIGGWSATSTPEVQFSVNNYSGTLSNGAPNFVSLSTSRAITVYTTGPGFAGRGTVFGSIDIRAPGGSDVVSADFSLNATDTSL